VAWCIDHLKPTESVSLKSVTAIVKRLDTDDFSTREEAIKELIALGERIRPHLESLSDQHASAEIRRNINRVLSHFDTANPSGSFLRNLRALSVLESADGEEPRAALERLSQGAPASRLTIESKAALDRYLLRSVPK
jgi:hypothetical protein